MLQKHIYNNTDSHFISNRSRLEITKMCIFNVPTQYIDSQFVVYQYQEILFSGKKDCTTDSPNHVNKSSNVLIIGSSGQRKPWFVGFADFYSVNVPTSILLFQLDVPECRIGKRCTQMTLKTSLSWRQHTTGWVSQTLCWLEGHTHKSTHYMASFIWSFRKIAYNKRKTGSRLGGGVRDSLGRGMRKFSGEIEMLYPVIRLYIT